MTGLAESRRRLLAAAGAGLYLAIDGRGAAAATGKQHGQEKKVGAVEDLMREHGVLRRALCVYTEAAGRLRAGDAVDPRPLNSTARLFRDFGENYHERMLEQAHIFPAVKKAGGPAAALVPILIAQHDRGREITGYILAVTGTGAIAKSAAEPLARAFDTFVLMYRNHAAREDTIVFPAWKKALSARRLDQMGEMFEDIEKRQFGKDGFEDAARRMAEVEQALGFADLARFTAPPPPKA